MFSIKANEVSLVDILSIKDVVDIDKCTFSLLGFYFFKVDMIFIMRVYSILIVLKRLCFMVVFVLIDKECVRVIEEVEEDGD